jgi:hypothetical protein
MCDKDLTRGETADVNACIADCTAYTAAYRADWLRPLADCYVEATCTADDDCGDTIQVEALDAHEEWAASCRVKSAECGASAEEVALACDLDQVVSVAPSVMEDLTACYDEPCNAIPSCIDAVLPG